MSEPRLKIPRLGVDPAIFSNSSHASCGTYAGVQQHAREGTEVCDECREARNEYTAWRRFKTGHVRAPRSCPLCSSVFPGHTCSAPHPVTR